MEVGDGGAVGGVGVDGADRDVVAADAGVLGGVEAGQAFGAVAVGLVAGAPDGERVDAAHHEGGADGHAQHQSDGDGAPQDGPAVQGGPRIGHHAFGWDAVHGSSLPLDQDVTLCSTWDRSREFLSPGRRGRPRPW